MKKKIPERWKKLTDIYGLCPDVAPRTLRWWCEIGKLPAKKIHDSWCIDMAEMIIIFNELKNKGRNEIEQMFDNLVDHERFDDE